MVNMGWGQIAQFNFPSTNSLVVSTKNANVSVSDISLSSGTIETNCTTGDYFPNEPYIEETGGWTAAEQSSAKCFLFTITANIGYSFSITNISFKAYSTPAGPSAFSAEVDGTSITVTNAPSESLVNYSQAVSKTGLSSAVIKIQGWLNGSRESAGTGTFRIDDLTITGIITELSYNAWINEIHYDNDGTDANEGVEIIVEDPSNYSLSNFTVYLYNGSDGTSYDSETLDNFTVGSSLNGFTIYSNFGSTFNGMQNGPDGIALSYQGYLIQFLSYEGYFTATSGIASGITSTDIGLEESSSTTSTQSLQLIGNGTTYTDFTWTANLTQTWGSPNNNGSGIDQSLPASLASFIAEQSGNNVALVWRTESETENLGFIIQRQLRVTSSELRVAEWVEIASYTTSDALAGHGSTSEAHEYCYTDAAVVPGATYFYRLGDVDYGGKVKWHKEVEVKIEVEEPRVSVVFGLQAAYPNPFNPVLTIPYGLIEDGQMTLKVYNLRGELVEVLKSTYALKGTYSMKWSPQNLSAGIYIIRMLAGNHTSMQKVVFVK